MTDNKKGCPGEKAAPQDHNNGSPKFSTTKLSSDLHRVGGKFKVRFEFQKSFGVVVGLRCEWHPHKPTPREARNKIDWPLYLKARDLFMQDVAAFVGGDVLCVDVPGPAAATGGQG
jgi:hypothetical protein